MLNIIAQYISAPFLDHMMNESAATTDHQTPPTLSPRAVSLDTLERALVAALFFRFAWVLLSSGPASTLGLDGLLICSEAIAFILVLLRAPTETLSRRSTDWFIGIVGTILPLQVAPTDAAPLASYSLCYAIMVAGTFLQLSAKIVMGRRFGVVAANRGIVTTGPYRFVRHPIYAGYTITHIGFLLAMPSILNTVFYAAALCAQIMRIYREEQVLVRDRDYCTYAEKVRFRLLPGVF